MRKEQLFEVLLSADAARGGRGRSLVSQLKAAIVDGRLKPGTKLPPTRKAPVFLAVSRNTASAVYDELLVSGYIVARRGAGTYVADILPSQKSRRKTRPLLAPPFRLNNFWTRPDVTAAMGFWQDKSEGASKDGSPSIDFRPALVSPRLFPFGVFRRILSHQMRTLERKPATLKSPQGNQGNYSLRTAIVNHIALTRAVVCQVDEVIVTAGAQQAFDLLARILVTPNETVVAVEDPGYPPLRVAFAAAGARVIPIPIDDEGIVVEKIPFNASVICLSPSHQFPMGMTTSMRRRKALVAFARAHHAVIVEDDYDGEFRYSGGPMEALRSAEAADVVFYVGTFSKCMFPALRLGFLVAPEWATKPLIAAKNCVDWHCPVPLQLAVAAFIAEGHLARHVRKLRHVYRGRHQALVEGLRDKLSDWLRPIASFYGMHMAAVSCTRIDLNLVSSQLEREGIKVHTFDRYYFGTSIRQGFVFGFGAMNEQQIREGLSCLQHALKNY